MQGSVPEVTTTARYADGYPAGSLEDFRVNVGDRTFFDYDEVNLSNNAKGTLARQAAWLLQRPTLRIVIEGHADERGTREYNLALGEHRAAAVRDYLVALGLPAARLSTVSYGSERPAIPGSNEAAWSQNRRAVTVPQYTEIQ
jgi:peptidoglycan-associated lipoprotein